MNKLIRQPQVIELKLTEKEQRMLNSAIRRADKGFSGESALIQQKWDARRQRRLRQSLYAVCPLDPLSRPKKM